MTRRGLGLADERGSATVWVLALAGVLALVGAAMVLVGAAVVARHRATTAADLAALAGAGRAVVGGADAGAAADRVGSAHHPPLGSCTLLLGAVGGGHAPLTAGFGGGGPGSAGARAR